jgi:hypothetical protein
MPVPHRPAIYHITHVDNLVAIAADRALLSDAAIVHRGGPATAIGMTGIKQRRLTELEVKCYPGDYVGEYVPFVFCPRSIMLYILHRANHPELTYRGGQGPIVHLEADLHEAVEWATQTAQRWAFSLSNAGARYTEFRNDVRNLDDLDWDAIASNDFTRAEVKEGKQAEFLMRERFPWDLVRRIGVRSPAMQRRVAEAFGESVQTPSIVVRPDWYF